jgi:hypothetical protein
MGSVMSRTRAGYVNCIMTWIRIVYQIYSLLVNNHTNYDYNEYFSTRSFLNNYSELVLRVLTGTE